MEAYDTIKISPRKYGEYRGNTWSILVLLDDGSNSPADFYLFNRITGNYKHFKDFYAERIEYLEYKKIEHPSHYELLLIYENEPLEKRKYHFEYYADYFGHNEYFADLNHWS